MPTPALTGYEPLVAQFSDTSENNPTSWMWDFGNGQTSVVQSPPPVKYEKGTYTVSLTVSNQDAQNTVVKVGCIEVSGLPDSLTRGMREDFASAVDIDADATTILVGEPWYTEYQQNLGINFYVGRVSIFKRDQSGEWIKYQEVVGDAPYSTTIDPYGVAQFSGDIKLGTEVRIAKNNPDVFAVRGYDKFAFVYRRDIEANRYVQEFVVEATVVVDEQSFSSVDISATGDTIVLGDKRRSVAALWTGLVKVLKYNGASWESYDINAPASGFKQFGGSVTVNGDGSEVFVFSLTDDVTGAPTIHRFGFNTTNNTWGLIQQFSASTAYDHQYDAIYNNIYYPVWLSSDSTGYYLTVPALCSTYGKVLITVFKKAENGNFQLYTSFVPPSSDYANGTSVQISTNGEYISFNDMTDQTVYTMVHDTASQRYKMYSSKSVVDVFKTPTDQEYLGYNKFAVCTSANPSFNSMVIGAPMHYGNVGSYYLAGDTSNFGKLIVPDVVTSTAVSGTIVVDSGVSLYDPLSIYSTMFEIFADAGNVIELTITQDPNDVTKQIDISLWTSAGSYIDRTWYTNTLTYTPVETGTYLVKCGGAGHGRGSCRGTVSWVVRPPAPPTVPSNLFVFSWGGHNQHQGSWGLPQTRDGATLNGTQLVLENVIDVFGFAFSNSMLAITEDKTLYASGSNYWNLLNPLQPSSLIFYQTTVSELGSGWESFAIQQGADGGGRSTPVIINKNGVFYTWGSWNIYPTPSTQLSYADATPLQFTEDYKFTPTEQGMVAYNGNQTWFVGSANAFSDLGTKNNTSYEALAWEQIVGLPFEPIEVGYVNNDYVLLLDSLGNLWARAFNANSMVKIAIDVYTIITGTYSSYWGFIDKTGTIWIVNISSPSAGSNPIPATSISHLDPKETNFHRLHGGPYKSAKFSDWSVGLAAIDIGNKAWYWGWGNWDTAWWGTSVPPTSQIDVGGLPVKQITMTVDAVFLLSGTTPIPSVFNPNFTVNTTKGPGPLTATFTTYGNQSGVVSYAWDFGNGQTSTLPNPTPVTYTLGTYTVSLVITDQVGTSTTITKTNYITATPPLNYVTFNVDNTSNATQNTVDVVVSATIGKLLKAGTSNMVGAFTADDSYIRILDSSNVEVASNDDYIGGASYVEYVIPASGAYTIKFGAYDTGPAAGTGAWVLE